MESVKPGEHYTWGPRPRMGGGFTDERYEALARVDLQRYEAASLRLRELVGAGVPLGDEAAYVGRLIDWTNQRLEVIAAQREQARRKADADAQAAETLARYGLPPLPQELTPAEYRDEVHRQELARLAAQPPSTFDPNTKEGKAAALAELNKRDPRVTPTPDAIDVYMGRVDDPARPRR